MIIKLVKHNEFRFEVKEDVFNILIKSGHCEIKGQELLKNKMYIFKDTKSFIFAHTDSEIEINKNFDDYYISDDTNILQVLRFFSILTKNSKEPNFKLKADLENKKTFVVLGKGKSTFIQTISNYFVRYGKKVLVTELIPGSGFLLFPGCIVSNLFNKLIDCSDGVLLENPLVYFYGSKKIEYNPDHYNSILKNIDYAISKKEYDFHFILASEEILDRNDCFEGLNACKIVLKDEKLYNKLKNEKIYISGGAYENKPFKNKFFSGEGGYTSFNVKTRAKVVRIGEEFLAPETALPIGEERKIEKNMVVQTQTRKNMILGVSFADDEKDVVRNPVKSLVIVNEIGDGFLKVTSPQPSLKCTFLIQGELMYD